MKLVESLSCHVHDHVSFAARSMIYRTLWADKQWNRYMQVHTYAQELFSMQDLAYMQLADA
jgi:hypothetical protein